MTQSRTAFSANAAASSSPHPVLDMLSEAARVHHVIFKRVMEVLFQGQSPLKQDEILILWKMHQFEKSAGPDSKLSTSLLKRLLIQTDAVEYHIKRLLAHGYIVPEYKSRNRYLRLSEQGKELTVKIDEYVSILDKRIASYLGGEAQMIQRIGGVAEALRAAMSEAGILMYKI